MSDSILNFNSNFPDSLKDQSAFIEQTDNDGTLKIFSYKHCDNESSDSVKKIRGLIFDGEKPLFRSLGYMTEYNENTIPESFDFSKLKWYESEEGTLIKVFHSHEKWYISTHRKLDAFKSRWGSSESFGEIFSISLNQSGFTIETLCSALDKNNMYLFLIRNTRNNRIVSYPPVNPTVYYAGMICNNGDFSLELPIGLQIETKKELEFKTREDIKQYISNTDPFIRPGIIGFYPDGSQVKIISEKYQMYSKVRGNEPNVLIRYLSVRNNMNTWKLMHEVYPEHEFTFQKFETAILSIAKKIHNAYVKRFITKEYVVVSQEEYSIIRIAHGMHINNRQTKITFSIILNILSNYNGLYFLINKFLKE